MINSDNSGEFLIIWLTDTYMDVGAVVANQKLPDETYCASKSKTVSNKPFGHSVANAILHSVFWMNETASGRE